MSKAKTLMRADMTDLSFDFDKLEMKLQDDLEAKFNELVILEKEKTTIGNPKKLGEVVMNEIWDQFANQIGLDLTDETLIQKYDREYFEKHGKVEYYQDVAREVMQDENYKKANQEMKNQQKNGTLVDAYTGEKIGANEKANLDHVVARKEIYENPRRKQAGLSTEDLANKKENLQPTNEALNKSKGKKSVDEYTDKDKRAKREEDLKSQNEKQIKKIDESNLSPADKKAKKAKNNRNLKNKLAADEKRMKEADKKARDAINKDIITGAAKEIGKEAGKNAVKAMMVSSLFSFLQEIMKGFVNFIKNKSKSFKVLIDEIKKSLERFLKKVTSILQGGVTTFVGTVVTEILDPIIGMFKKFASFIKQGIKSCWDAVKYLASEESRNQPFSIKIAQVGKIITAGLVAAGAIALGEVLEKALMSIPVMNVVIPLVGSLANIIGMFLASVVSGVIGAITINYIDKIIAKRREANIVKDEIKTGNKILETQERLINVGAEHVSQIKDDVKNSINTRHEEFGKFAKDFCKKVSDNHGEWNHQSDFENQIENLNGI